MVCLTDTYIQLLRKKSKWDYDLHINKHRTSFAEYVWYYFLIFHFKYLIYLLVFLLEDTFSVFSVKYRATKSIPENFQSASPQIWKCCFVSDFVKCLMYSLSFFAEITKTLNFKHDQLENRWLSQLFPNCFSHFRSKHLNTQFQNI